MPLYVYKCKDCGKELEVLTYTADCKDTLNCPKCKKETMVRVPAKPNLKFNGKGFHSTDYPK